MKSILTLLLLASGISNAQNNHNLDFSFKDSSFIDSKTVAISDSIYSVNQNLGSFNASFKVTTPKNFTKFNELKFTYNSHNLKNVGLGVGFSLEIPSIRKNHTTNKKFPYLFSGMGTGELVKTEENIQSLYNTISTLIRISTDLQFETYRPFLEKDFSLFIKITDFKGVSNGWLILLTDGSKWLLDSKGKVKKLFNISGKYIEFNWEQNLLYSITDNVNNWKLGINYLAPEPNSLESYFIGDNLYQYPKGIQNIVIESKGKVAKTINFDYIEGYISEVKYESAKFPIFKADYNTMERTSNITQDTEGMPSKDQWIDFNGDLIKDSLSIDISPLQSFIRNFKFSFDSKNKATSKSIEKFKHGIRARSTYNVKSKLSNGKSKYSDKNIDSVIRKIMGQLDIKYNNGYKYTHVYYKPIYDYGEKGAIQTGEERVEEHYYFPQVKSITPRNKLFTADMNRDGRPDLISCPINAKLEEKTVKNGAKKVLSNLHAQIISELSPSLLEKKDFTNPMADKGSLGVIYLQKHNPEAAKNKDFKNLYSLERSAEAINCNQFSIFSDLNKDGNVDIVTGSNIVYRNEEGQNIEKSNISLDQIYELSSSEVDIEKPLKLVDINKDGVFELINAESVTSNLLTGEITIYSKDSKKTFSNLRKEKLLTTLHSPFGATKKITYKNKDGKYISDRVEILSDDMSSIVTYEYLSPIHSGEHNLFTGYSKVNKHYEYINQSIESKKEEYQYGMDLNTNAERFNIRSRLNGFLLSKKMSNSDNSSYVRETNKLAYIDLNDNRIFPYTSVKEKSTVDLFNGIATGLKVVDTAVYDLAQLENKLQTPPQMSTRVKSTEQNSNDNLLVLNEKLKSVCNFEFNTSNYVLNKTTCSKTVRDQPSNLAKEVRSFDKFGKIKSECAGNKCTNYIYDESKRLSRIESNHNDSNATELYYLGETVVIDRKVDELGTQKYTFDLMGRKIRSVNTNGLIESYSWNADGLLESFTRSGNSIFALNSYSNNSATYTQNGENGTVEFNQLGKIVRSSLGSIIGGLSKFSTTGLLLEKNSNSFTADHKTSEINKYDYLHRVVQSNKFPSSDSESMYSYNYFRTNSETFVNDNLLTVKVAGPISNRIIEEHYKGSPFGHILDEGSNITKLLTDNHEWEYNKYGEVVSFNFKEKKENGVDEIIFERLIEDLGTSIIYPDGFTTKTRHDGRLLETHPASNKDLLENQTFEHGKVKSYSLSNSKGEKLLDTVHFYDTANRIESTEINSLTNNYEYDKYDRITSVTSNDSTRKVDYTKKFEYRNDNISSVFPYISEILRDSENRITKVVYSNGNTLYRSYFANGLLKSISLMKGETTLFTEEYAINDKGLYSSSLTRTALQKNNELRDFEYNGFKLDNQAKENINDSKFEWNRNNLSKVADVNFYYDANSQLKASCSKESTAPSAKCFYMIDDNNYFYGRSYVELLKVDGLPLGVFINGKFMPVVSDKLNSIRGLFNQKDGSAIWFRDYSIWGEKSLNISISNKKLARALDRSVIWNFAHLIAPPNYVNTHTKPELYWSQSRVYSPVLKRWLTIDPLGKWNPNTLMSQAGNWELYSYCNNDPVNFVDPSGYVAVKIGWQVSGDGGVGASYSKGMAFSYSQEHGFQIGSYKSFTRALGAKAGVNAGVRLSLSNADKLKDLEGVDVGVGGGSVSGYWKIGGGAGLNFSKTKEGKSITELELNAGFGIGGGIGGQFSGTDIELWDDGKGPERLQFQDDKYNQPAASESWFDSWFGP